MSRIINEDFSLIQQFFSDYSLEQIMQDRSFMQEFKLLHRKAYALLIFIAELEEQNKREPFISETTLKYKRETLSDLMLAFFCWVNGAYKPANLQMRSCIENFIKCLLFESTPNIITEKSVYKVFDLAKANPIFTDPIGIKNLNILSCCYSELCQVAHGEISSLSEINALNFLPTYDKVLTREFVGIYSKLLEAILSTIFKVYYNNVYKMHSLNQDLFFQGLKKGSVKEIISYIYCEVK